ncbi:MAG: translation elongation factor Ts [Gammaproteobacteria bacterium]|nr:translation elongation factor Ts [Gammaproteobacteria bacterium]
MSITASMVKELRERTGSGMMECKKALVETDGDIEAAIELMRKSGLAKAGKRAGKVAAEGVIEIAESDDGRKAAMVEVNSETDFVAKGDDFREFSAAVAKTALEQAPDTLEALLAAPLAGGEGSVDEVRQALVAKIGENINVRRFVLVEAGDGALATYLHGTRIGVVVAHTGDETLGKDLAMHVAASRPVCVTEADVPADLVEKEREIFSAQAAESGKPANIVEKMVEGRLRKFLAEITLVGQPFVKDPDQTVGKLLDGAGAKVSRFTRFEVGEGIEKKQENFAAEVMAQVQGG